MLDILACQRRDAPPLVTLLVLGQATFTSSNYASATHFSHPWSVAIDPTTGAVFVADTDHHRVLRFASLASLTAGACAEAAFGQPDLVDATPATGARGMREPTGVLVDQHGSLWVADTGNHRVLRFDNATHLYSGAPANAVLGQPNDVSAVPATDFCGMQRPSGLACDAAGTLWVADTDNHRVLRFDNAARLGSGASASAVLGQPNLSSRVPTDQAGGLSSPCGLALDSAGSLWVADMGNHRVLRFDHAADLSDGAAASAVLGQPGFGNSVPSTSSIGMSRPCAVATDPRGRLWVADLGNHRVLRFEHAASLGNGAPAHAVLGQPDFVQRSHTVSAQGLDTPSGLATDQQGQLWVVDQGNHRVLRFEQAANLPNGAPAIGLLGHTGFTMQRNNSARTLDHPEAVVLDPITGKVFVADTCNHRVLRFADPSRLVSGAPAEAVLGQPDFSSAAPGVGNCAMRFPLGLVLDRYGSLWVADTGNHRVLRFDRAGCVPSGTPASAVLGQPDFTSNTAMTTASGMYRPSGLAYDSDGSLWVADTFNNRVLRFDHAADLPDGAPASIVLGQPDVGRSAAVAGPSGMYRPRGLAADSSGRLWVADTGNHRVLRFDRAASLPSSARADAVLGQPDLFRNAPSSDAVGMHNPAAVALDHNEQLWVADTFNNRVLCFATAAHLPNGATPTSLLGQPPHNSSDPGTTAHGLHHPGGLAVDVHGHVWVADTFHSRVLCFGMKEYA